MVVRPRGILKNCPYTSFTSTSTSVPLHSIRFDSIRLHTSTNERSTQCKNNHLLLLVVNPTAPETNARMPFFRDGFAIGNENEHSFGRRSYTQTRRIIQRCIFPNSQLRDSDEFILRIFVAAPAPIGPTFLSIHRSPPAPAPYSPTAPCNDNNRLERDLQGLPLKPRQANLSPLQPCLNLRHRCQPRTREQGAAHPANYVSR